MDDKKWLRMIYIYDALQHGEKIRRKEVAEHFHVSLRTIGRDMSDLEEYLDEQVPPMKLHYDSKDHTHSLLAPERPELDCGELLAVCKILLESRSMPKKEMDRILDKLLSARIFSQNEKTVQKIIANERYHYMEPHHGKELTNQLWILGQAIQSRNLIEALYRTQTGKENQWTLQPVGLMFSEYYFYLTAFIENIDQKAHFENADDLFPTIFRVDRLQSVKVLNRHFHEPSYGKRFSEGEFRKRVQFMYGGKLQIVRFIYSGPSVEAVLDRLPTAEIMSEKEGAYEIRAEVFGTGIEMWLRSQGDYVRLL